MKKLHFFMVTIIFYLIGQVIFIKQVSAENISQASEQKHVQVPAQSNASLAEELAQLTSQVLTLNRELFILEEDLLFPASTQISVFVSVDIGKFFTLDSVELKINSKNVAGFLYTERQRIALEQGGIQKLYLGNLTAGQHQLTAIFIGKDNNGRMAKKAQRYQFDKDDEAIMIEVKLVDQTQNLRSELIIEEWVL